MHCFMKKNDKSLIYVDTVETTGEGLSHPLCAYALLLSCPCVCISSYMFCSCNEVNIACICTESNDFL